MVRSYHKFIKRGIRKIHRRLLPYQKYSTSFLCINSCLASYANLIESRWHSDSVPQSCGPSVKGLQPQNSLYSCGTVPDSNRIPHDCFPYIILCDSCMQDIKVKFLMPKHVCLKNIHFYDITMPYFLQYTANISITW